jgi:hypothetical protein
MNLCDFVTNTLLYHLSCARCPSKIDSEHIESLITAARKLGWRVIASEVYCGKCVFEMKTKEQK